MSSACAACGGGGCDTCGRSGAITLRQRDEPAEMVEVTLPARGGDDLPDSRGITLRIPELGGLPELGSELPRGVLLLTVVPSHEPDANVKLLRGIPSKRPPASVVESDEMPTHLAEPVGRRGRAVALVIVIIAVVAEEPNVNGGQEREDQGLDQAHQQLLEIEHKEKAGAVEWPADRSLLRLWRL